MGKITPFDTQDPALWKQQNQETITKINLKKRRLKRL